MEDLTPVAPTLNRALSPVGVMMLTFSALSPVASVYIGGAGVLHLAGTGAALAFLAGGVVAALMALIYAELGAAFPRAGGPYPSYLAVLGPAITFPNIVISLLAAPAFMAFAALGFADYARVLAPGLPLLPVAIGVILLASGVAILNVRTGAWVTGAFLAVEGVALAALTAVALLHPARGVREVFAHPVMLTHGHLTPVSLATMGLAVVAGAWACAGASWAMYFGEELKDAPRRIGRVIAWSGLIASLTIAVPMALLVFAIGDLKSDLAAEAPIAVFLARTGGPAIAAVVSIGVIAAIFNNLIAAGMGLGRFIYATGRDGIWPGPVNRVFAMLHPRLRSPVVATVLLAGASVIAVLAGERALIIFLSGDVIGALLISLAVLVGRRRGLTGARFATPLWPLLPIFGLLVTAATTYADWLDKDAGRPSMFLIDGLFVAGLIYYQARLRRAGAGWRSGELSEPATGAAPQSVAP